MAENQNNRASGEGRNDEYFLELAQNKEGILLFKVKNGKKCVGNIKYSCLNGNMIVNLGTIPSWKQAGLVQQAVEMSNSARNKGNCYGESASLGEKFKGWVVKKILEFDLWDYWINN